MFSRVLSHRIPLGRSLKRPKSALWKFRVLVLLTTLPPPFQRGNQITRFSRRAVRGFTIAINTLSVVSPLILILRGCQETFVTVLVVMTYSPGGSNGMSTATLDPTLQLLAQESLLHKYNLKINYIKVPLILSYICAGKMAQE